MPDLDSRSLFYLGRDHDLASGKTSAEPLLYKSSQLTTHAVCVGMTGSGKTGLCVSLLEEAALDGIPSILIDPKGDLGNLLLAFPDLRPEDFRPWIDPGAAQRRGVAPEAFAAETATQWREGLAQWGQGSERLRRYADSTERVLYTPGSSTGIPMSVLKSFAAPPRELIDDADMYRARLGSAASGLLALLGIAADPVQSREHIYLSNVLDCAWRAGRDLGIEALIHEIQRPMFDKVGVVNLDAFFPAADRAALSMRLNNLIASPAFAGWMEGVSLNVAELLHSPEGKPRMSILSIAHLDDAQRMFFVTILLNEVLAWMRTQPGTDSLRAILYMDEVFGYFPPLASPPSKLPMLTLLKQARAFGLGCVLATQNPVDLDYKGLSNAGTWFLGRLQTERDKARVIEGLEGASTQAGAQFNKQQMEATLAGLGNRVFLMNNVHLDAPVVFRTRWALSYLRGPLSREQVKTLMDPLRARFTPPEPVQPPSASNSAAVASRPLAPEAACEGFAVATQRIPRDAQLRYVPALWGHAKTHFVQTRSPGIDVWKEVYVLELITPKNNWNMLWSSSECLPEPMEIAERAEFEAPFDNLPAELLDPKAYKGFATELKEHIYQTQRLELLRCADLDEISQPEEPEAEFRSRLADRCDAALKAELDKIEARFAPKRRQAEAKINKKEQAYQEQKSQFWSRLVGAVGAVISVALAVFGGKALTRRSTSSMSAARQAATEHGQASRAEAELALARTELEELENQLDHDRVEAALKYDPSKIALETVAVAPRKGDLDIEQVRLLWLPVVADASGERLMI